MKFRFVHFVVLLFLSVFCLAQSNPAKREQKPKPPPLTSHVVLISIDGLRNEDFINPKLNLPTLRALQERGAFALNVETVYPSQSLPAHATMVTGMFPADHGIPSDLRFDETKGITSTEKYRSANDIKTDTIWQAAKRAGLKIAALNFPLLEGADIDFKLQETDVDWSARPQLALIRFEALADALQRFGMGSPEAIAALEAMDAALRKILAAIEKAGLTNETTILIVSSHGYAKVEQEFRPNVILAKKGFLRLDAKGIITDWIATTYASGGTAAVYLRDAKNEAAIGDIVKAFEEIHQRESSPIWRVLSRKDAAKLGADPRAAFFVEAAPGFVMSEQTTGKKTTEKLNAAAGRAAAGYLPSRSEMRGALIAVGKGIKPKVQIEYARLVDIAPTIARLLGLELKASRGHALSEILVLPTAK